MNLAEAEHLMMLRFLAGQQEKIRLAIADTNAALRDFSRASAKQFSQFRSKKSDGCSEHLTDLCILLRHGLATEKLYPCSPLLERNEMNLVESVIAHKVEMLMNTAHFSRALVDVLEGRLIQALDPPQDFHQAMLAVLLEDPVIAIASEAQRITDKSIQQFLSVVENWSKSNQWLSRE